MLLFLSFLSPPSSQTVSYTFNTFIFKVVEHKTFSQKLNKIFIFMIHPHIHRIAISKRMISDSKYTIGTKESGEKNFTEHFLCCFKFKLNWKAIESEAFLNRTRFCEKKYSSESLNIQKVDDTNECMLSWQSWPGADHHLREVKGNLSIGEKVR